MNRNFLLLTLMLLLPVCGQAKLIEVKVVLYATSTDFINKENGIAALAIVKDTSTSHLMVKEFVDNERKRIKRSRGDHGLSTMKDNLILTSLIQWT